MIQNILTQPEGKRLEFKEKMPEPLALAKTACAFANGSGGTVVIGVRDRDRRIMGLDEREIPTLEEKAANILHTMVEPMVASHITVHNLEGKLLLKVDIFPGGMKPYHLKEKGEAEGTYIRVGSTNRKADEETVGELRRQRMNIGFDEVPVLEARRETLESENISYYLLKRKEVRDIPEVRIDDELLLKIRALKKVNGDSYPTVGGTLLFSNEPEMVVPGAVVKCARFKGLEMGEFLDQREITGPLFKQVEGVMEFFKRNVKRGARIKGIYRKEEYEYPPEAVREAVINAICHRDYSRKGSDVKFAIFDDRIEVTSPGGLPAHISPEDLGTGVSELRNRTVGRIFNEMGLIEGWGTGIRRIRHLTEERRLKAPEFKEHANSFKVTLHNTPVKELPPLDETEETIIGYIQEHGKASTGELEDALDKSRATIKRKIKSLLEKEYIEWKGKSPKDPTGYYVLAGSL